ncbi:hypothetical protein [Spirillospora sp. CA-294931]|uniref:hypothetical protein n=1 Tax=Spirillospora sp. CA-294931 TaxID=3240042 RepID=UPI003D94BA68
MTATRSRRVRITAAVASVPPLLAGAGLTVGAGLQAGEGGYFGSGEHRFASSTAVLKTDEIQVGETTARADDPMPDLGEVARVKIVLAPSDPSVPVFVGIGPKDQVERYLRGVAHDRFVSAELKPFRASFERVAGAAPSAPAAQGFWGASSAGTGTRTLTWDKTKGPWSVAVVRLDGRPGLDVRAWVGLRFGFLLPAGLAALAAGAVLLLVAAWPTRR